MKHGAQMKLSANSPLFTAASDSSTADYTLYDPTQLPISTPIKLTTIRKAVNIPPLIAKSNGGRNTTAPQLIDYINARTATGAKVYTDPEGILSDEAYAETIYRTAVENFVNEKSMEVIPLNGTSVLTNSLISVSSSTYSTDISLIPHYKQRAGSCGMQSVFGQTSCVIGGDFVIPACPGNVSTLLSNPILTKTMRTNNIYSLSGPPNHLY